MLRTPFFAILGLLSLVAIASAESQKPNIILILADDLGYETLGSSGGTSYKTPNLDRLAAGGVRFERCQVQPLCTPTRVQLMTGMSNARNYIDFGQMDPQATTFGNLLKNAGYATAITGKWQLGRDKDLPRKFGFDEFCLWQHTRRPPRYANPGLEYNGEERDFKNGEYGPDLVCDFALDFITKNKSKPFFLYYPMILTHAPYQPTPDSADWDPKAMGEGVNKSAKHFADNVAYMDKLVGKVVKKVDDLGLRDNTLVIFLGDNGTGKGITSQFKTGAYQGGKGLTTARGMHVPLIASWPGHTGRGGVNDDLIDSTDVLPTICAAAGVEVPKSLEIDGRSFFPQIEGHTGDPREWIYTWYSQNGGPPVREFVTTKEYKLYRNGRFFDLRKDPFEDNQPKQLADLSGAESAAAKKMRAALAKFADARPAALRKTATDTKPRNPSRKAARQARRQSSASAPVAPIHYTDHQDLSFYIDDSGGQFPIRTPADWQHRRAQIVAGMEEIMGPLPHPEKPVPLDVQVVEEHQEDGYIRRKLAYHTDDLAKRVRAWLLIPSPAKRKGDAGTTAAQNRRPAMLCLQQTTKSGKDSPVGLADRPTLHYALELAKRGYVTLSPDYPSFGEYPYDFDADNYQSGSMKAIYDNTRAIDVLESLPEVDPDRIGCIGHSLGGHNSLFTAVFDPRIKAVVTSCGFTSFHKNHGGNILNWSGPRYMPLIVTKYKNPDLMPFEFQEVLAAIAPRPIFVVAPLHDSDFEIEGVREVIQAARPIFKLLGNADGLQVMHPDSKHDFPDKERNESYVFLDRVLNRHEK